MARAFLRSCIAAAVCAPALVVAQTGAPQPDHAAPGKPPLQTVDVVVTDAQRHAIHNLQASDFVLLEDSHQQTISAFEEHHTPEAAAPLTAGPSVPGDSFSNLTIAPAPGALNILLLDLLNAPPAERADLRNRMVRYLQQVHAGPHIAVLGLTTRLILLQGFNSAPQQLSSVLTEDEEPATPPAAPPRGKANAEENASAAPATEGNDGNNPSAAQVRAALHQFLADAPVLSFQQRARITLDAMNQLVRSFGRLPGRKNLIWLSAGFPINLQPDGTQPTPFAAVASSEDEYRETVSMLAHSQVSVYPINAGNHPAAPVASGPNPNAKYMRGPVSHIGNPADFYQLTAEDPGAMQAMASATGGAAIPLAGDLASAVAKATDLGANYYALTYTPAAETENGAYRAIQVKLAKLDFTLAYRHAYFTGVPAVSPPAGPPQPTSKKTAPYDALHTAMVLAAPVPTQIAVSATVASLSADRAASPFRRYSVQLRIGAKDIACPALPDGVHQCTLDLAISAFDAAGASLELAKSVLQANIPEAHFADTLASGLPFKQDLAMPLASAAYLRIGIRDHATDKVGVVELPLAGLPVAMPANPPQPSTGSAADPHPPRAPEP